MKRVAAVFKKPFEIELRQEILGPPSEGEVLIRTEMSAISSGTELLVYRGLFPRDMALDAAIDSLSGAFAYPAKYGYAAVGRVIGLGAAVDAEWKGRRVFGFHAHESLFSARVQDLVPIPDHMDLKDALFLANMETALNFLMDGCPMIGERVVIFGQGIVGLLTVALLARCPLETLISLDPYPLRRKTSQAIGARTCLDPLDPDCLGSLQQMLSGEAEGGLADLVYELSGNPQALNQALQVTGFDGRVVIGSWYGQKHADLDLGGRFHRSRIRLVSSQVSSLAPELSGRWTKARRLMLALEMLDLVKPSRFITHRFEIENIARAFDLLDQRPETAIQVIVTY